MSVKKELKGHPGYHVTGDGEIIRPDGAIADKFINNRGYYDVIVNKKIFKMHQLVISIFNPDVPKYLRSKGIPNHFDLDRCNNNILNLDWVDDQLNLIHSSLMRNKNPTHFMLKTMDEFNSCQYYTSIYKCADALGLGLMETWEYIKSGNNYEGKFICYLQRAEREILNSMKVLHSFRRVVSCFDFGINQQLPDMRVWELSKIYNLTPQLIMEHITDEITPRYLLGDLLISTKGVSFSSLPNNEKDYRKLRLIYMGQNPLRFKLYTQLNELVKDNPLEINSDELLTEYEDINASSVFSKEVIKGKSGYITHVPTDALICPESYILNKLF